MANKDERRKVALFIVAALFAATQCMTGRGRAPKESFDDAEAFLKEAEARGIDVTTFGDSE